MPTWKLARQAVRNGHPLPDEVSTASTTGSLCAAKQQSAAVKGNKGTRWAQELTWTVTQATLNDAVNPGFARGR